MHDAVVSVVFDWRHNPPRVAGTFADRVGYSVHYVDLAGNVDEMPAEHAQVVSVALGRAGLDPSERVEAFHDRARREPEPDAGLQWSVCRFCSSTTAERVERPNRECPVCHSVLALMPAPDEAAAERLAEQVRQAESEPE